MTIRNEKKRAKIGFLLLEVSPEFIEAVDRVFKKEGRTATVDMMLKTDEGFQEENLAMVLDYKLPSISGRTNPSIKLESEE